MALPERSSASKPDFYVAPNGDTMNPADFNKYKDVYNNPKYYDPKTGEMHWPGQNGDPNTDGFVNGVRKPDVLKKGHQYERFGDNGNAHYYTKVGDSLESRALPPGSEYKKTIKIEPTVDIPCTSGDIAPWFDQPGMAKQYFTTETRDELEKAGKIIIHH